MTLCDSLECVISGKKLESLVAKLAARVATVVQYHTGEGGEGEQPPEGVEEEGAPSEEEEEDEEGGEQEGDSQASSQPPSPGSPLLAHESDNALILRESASPSRDSRGSSLPRCGSRESAASDRADVLSLMPPAVILGTGPGRLGSVSPLVASSSPPMLLPANCQSSPRSSPLMDASDAAVLDFSTKRSSSPLAPVLNLSKASTPALSPVETHLNSPLDLSVSSRKRSHDDSPTTSSSPSPTPRKTPRVTPADFKSVVSPWTSPAIASHLPYFVAAVANSLSPKNNTHDSSSLWNGKMKLNDKSSPTFPFGPMPSDATKALEKMSELSKLGGDEFKPMGNSVLGGGAGGRHSAWQSHWQNKGADQAKDVLKCVWCKQSFPSLAAMTVHMKEAKHCGVNVPVPPIQPPPPPIPQSPQNSSSSGSNSMSGGQGGPNSNKPSASDLNLLIKETMPLPRKLVRGQDVWLGKGAEQTRQILKCMWCGQSFRSLAEMTSHMQQTQHYTNIISQEQIISWKSADEGKSGSQGGGASGGSSGSSVGAAGSGGGGPGATSSHVSAVLTCKVCDQAFSSLKELSNHMVKNSHYKEHIMRSITESGGRRRQTREKRKKSLPVRKLLELERAQNEMKNGEGIMLMGNKPGRELHSAGRITCEKCGEKIDMAVFVDHIRLCIGGGHIGSDQRNLLKNALLSSNVLPPESQITQALQESRKIKRDEQSRQQQSPSSATDLSMPPSSPKEMATKQEGKSSSPSVLNAIEKLIEKSFDSRSRHGAGYPGAMGSPGQGPIGSSILKRLGIDESVDYTKPLVDPQTMNLLRSYHHHHASQYARRERSGSESSSISERGRNDSLTPDRKFDSSDRLMSSTPRTTPEKRIQTPPSAKMSSGHESNDEEILIKKEIDDSESLKDDDGNSSLRNDVHVKKEEGENGDDEDDRRSYQSDEPLSQMRLKEEPLKGSPERSVEEFNDEDRKSGGGRSPSMSPRQPTPGRPSSSDPVANSPCRNSASPASSDRSGTPRSTDRKASGSLGALSSMFDSLSGGGGGANCQGEPQAGTAVKGTSHPLAALQKLCDKTETHHHPSGGSGSRSSSAVPMNPGMAGGQGSSTSTTVAGTTPGGILALSWACNEAVVTADSIMKCAFCDTPFISKGAYRHHLSKMHFLKDGVIPDPVALKSQAGNAQQSAAVASSKSSGSNGNNAASTSSSSAKSPPAQPNNYEESPHSKFLKYTELAKQLSSKYV
ncbi:protein tiptop-like isoform X1 [Nilaparvata lugens]|uniref:protein tiptop-like isoform X1 n=1 Tax=Nilaparvata lugens TaxID=108931 RepID=UPI00193CC74D|nr:protein tiptop-like isoform X1 [Nilaparvata lugens]